MKRSWTAVFLVLFWSLIAAGPSLGRAEGKFSLRIQGGWSCFSAGDINPGTQAFFDWYVGYWPASDGGYRALHNGYELGGDFIFELRPWLGLGIGGGYLRSSRTSQMSFWLIDPGSDVGGVIISAPKLSAVPIRLGLFLTVPLSKKLNFQADAGASCYFGARYSDEWHMWESQMATVMEEIQVVTRAERKQAPLGFQGGIGLELELQHNLFLSLDARGRYARFCGWAGTSVIYIYEIGDEATFSERGLLYYEDVPTLPGSPRLIMVQSDPPDGPNEEPRQAVVDFNGVSLQVGIRVRL